MREHAKPLQDYIALARNTARTEFVRRLEGPLLVVAKQRQEPRAADETKIGNQEVSLSASRLARLHAGSEVIATNEKPRRVADAISLGRADDNDVPLADDTISGHHAELVLDDVTGRVTLEDLGSTNGTEHNDEPVHPGKPVDLSDGDVVCLGDAVYLFFTPGGFHDALRLIGGF